MQDCKRKNLADDDEPSVESFVINPEWRDFIEALLKQGLSDADFDAAVIAESDRRRMGLPTN